MSSYNFRFTHAHKLVEFLKFTRGFMLNLGLGQTSLFSCAEPDVNEGKSLF